jgi:hypothetical protein
VTQSAALAQGKGKKRTVGWFPASYVKLMEAKKDDTEAAGGQPVAAGPFHISL